MAYLYFGHKKTTIGFGEALAYCPACESHRWSEIMVSSLYYHVYWIPVFPYGKEVNVECEHCGLKRYDLVFTDSLFPNMQEVKSRFKHPWYTYIITILFALLFLIPIIINISS